MIFLWIVLIILLLIAILELYNPKMINEGFSNVVAIADSALWAKWMPRRGDVSLNPTEEESGYIRDIRYFAGYTDVQRLGLNHDFCRMVQLSSNEKDKFFACALGGTEGLSTVKYRTPSVKDGFETSRDDYMNKLGEGRAGYCRIIKIGDAFEARCNPAGDHSFQPDTIVDSNPPDDIIVMLQFYEGIVFWLRMRDDLLDYAKNLIIAKGGTIHIDEVPSERTEGLSFNGEDEFLRIGDTSTLEFGDKVQLRYVRAVSFWVYFEEFTNNAKIYDFGNGPGMDNVVVGIIGRGNIGTQQETQLFCNESNTIPDAPSGQQCVHEQSPQTAMLTSSANIDVYNCPNPEIFGRMMEPIQSKSAKPDEASTADLLYEIWDNRQRVLHVQVKNVFPLKKWTHITITTTSNTSFTAGLAIYKNGEKIHSEENAPLPQTNYTKRNYIGKSNWSNVTSNDINADELFKGRLFDFRGYKTMMTEKKIKNTIKWGKRLLGEAI